MVPARHIQPLSELWWLISPTRGQYCCESPRCSRYSYRPYRYSPNLQRPGIKVVVLGLFERCFMWKCKRNGCQILSGNWYEKCCMSCTYTGCLGQFVSVGGGRLLIWPTSVWTLFGMIWCIFIWLSEWCNLLIGTHHFVSYLSKPESAVNISCLFPPHTFLKPIIPIMKTKEPKSLTVFLPLHFISWEFENVIKSEFQAIIYQPIKHQQYFPNFSIVYFNYICSYLNVLLTCPIIQYCFNEELDYFWCWVWANPRPSNTGMN